MSLVAFKARNHRQQPVRDDVDDRRTPRPFFDRLHARHAFTVDAAASAENALLPVYWTRETDALEQRWDDHRVWCNPPYSDLASWTWKARWELANGCGLVVMLVPANRCEQKWWQRDVEPYRDGRYRLYQAASLRVDFLSGRMRFGWPETKVFDKRGDRPPFGCALLTWTSTARSDRQPKRDMSAGSETDPNG